METTSPLPPPLPAGGPSSAAASSSSIRNWNILCHASALLGVFFHFPGHLIGPLIVWLAKRDDSPQIDAHGKESLNFQLSMTLYGIVAGILCFVLIGIPLLIALLIADVVLVIIASVEANQGHLYRYPITIRFFR